MNKFTKMGIGLVLGVNLCGMALAITPTPSSFQYVVSNVNVKPNINCTLGSNPLVTQIQPENSSHIFITSGGFNCYSGQALFKKLVCSISRVNGEPVVSAQTPNCQMSRELQPSGATVIHLQISTLSK